MSSNAIQTKGEYVFSDLVEVEETTELKTKLAYNPEKNTAKISVSITTKQIDFSNEEVNEAIRAKISNQIKEATNLAKDLIQGNVSTDKDPIQFPDADEIEQGRIELEEAA